MDHGALRALVLGINATVFGVPVTVSLDAGDVATTGIWMTPQTEGYPGGLDLHRRDPRQVLVIPRSDVDSLPRGTVITAPEAAGGAVQSWRVDGFEAIEPDHYRAVVIPNA